MTMMEQPLKTYRANCHCAAYVYEVSLPEAFQTGLKCDCSYCYKKGAIYQRLESYSEIKFVKGGPAKLSSYKHGNVEHQFCPVCSTYLFRVSTKTHVNLRAFQEFHEWKLGIQPIDDAPTPAWSPSKFNGEEPSAKIEGSKVYTGGCHCGAVTLALKSKRIDSTYEANLLECNCSICTRNAYTWIYPSKAQVAIRGWDNISFYAFGRDYWKKSFCKTCGVSLHNHLDNYTPEEIAAMPDGRREWVTEHIDWRPINLRVLDGVELDKLPIKYVDGWSVGNPQYVNP
ncbi:hypothetical protein M426DRAFT_323289 [Hypoxylon sp. CI-4A]|nr:hypothetical protein M426DRAFT_323289 [Hypoxylon sp. CI-4A]